MNAAPLLKFRDLRKSFLSVPVLRDANFTLAAGHILGLVGENGAGKSTLMNILGGNLSPDQGTMMLNGRPYTPRDPTDARRNGIAFIHQELNLFTNLSIAENIYLTAFPISAGTPLINRTELHRLTADVLKQMGLDLPPGTCVESLPAGERQLVEIAKALSFDARLIILDEPATSLSFRETEILFALLERLRARGIAMIFISHNLSDVLRLCDDVVVLRDGAVVGSGSRADFSFERMISLMVGRSLSQLFPEHTNRPTRKVVLAASHLSQPGILRNVSFALREGEVLGVSGLMGAGRSELARILFGLDPCAQGEITLNGATLPFGDQQERVRRGLAFLTENRREEGLCLDAGIADNITLVSLPDFARTPFRFLDFAKLRDPVVQMRAAVHLTATARDSQPVKTLSGGNQQKVVLAKWLLAKPTVLMLDEPTRGIDIGAKAEIYQLIIELASRGAAVLVISSELEELIGLCDRILVMKRGEITDELDRASFDRERILRAVVGDAAGMASSRPNPA